MANRVLILLLFVSGGSHALSQESVEVAARKVLKQNCVGCHNQTRTEGGLRLDTNAQLLTGGDSGVPLVSRPGVSSELYRRLTTDDLSERMPVGGAPLRDSEIAAMVAWVNAGAEWSDDERRPADQTPFKRLANWLGEVTKHSKWILGGWVGLAVVVLMIERRKKSDAATWLRKIGGSHYLAVALSLVVVAMWQHFRSVQVEDQEKIESLTEQLEYLANPVAFVGGDEFGAVPRRPLHPPRMSGEYYRGNDERSPRLFNGGFYRTATFRIALVDDAGTKLDVGSSVPTGPVFLNFELHRAKGTTEAHYRESAMNTIFLSRQSRGVDVADTPVPLSVVDPKWLWHASYELISDLSAESKFRGRVFVYCSAMVGNGRITGHPHYGIEYVLNIVDGKIAEGSEMWMGSLFQTEKAVQTPKDRIPADSWFDFRKIPEVEGRNTDDPELLGIGKPDGGR